MPDPLDRDRLELDDLPEVSALLARCPDIEPLRYRDSEQLLEEGEEGRELFLVLEGALVVERAPEAPGAQKATLATLSVEPGSPCIVGEMAYFGAQRRTATVRSVGSTRALRLQAAHVDVILDGFPELTRLLCRQFTRRLQEANTALQGFQRRFDLAPQRRMAQDGEVLFRAGEPAAELLQMVVGTVELDRGGTLETVAPEDLPEGFLEPEAFLRARPHGATATVRGMAFLVSIDPAHREAFLRAYPQVALRVLEG